MVDEALEILKKTNALITNTHVVLTSGRHGNAYINKDAVYLHPQQTSRLCQMIAEHFDKHDVDIVIAPAVGGVILSQWVTYHLNQQKNNERILAAYADKKDDGGFVIKRGYDKLISGKKVLVVEDNVTTGGSVQKVIAAVRELKGEVIAAALLCNRGGVTSEDIGGVPELFSLMELDLQSWAEEECPLCKDDVPVNTDIGKGKDFLARKNSN